MANNLLICTACRGRGKVDDPPWGIVDCPECGGIGRCAHPAAAPQAKEAETEGAQPVAWLAEQWSPGGPADDEDRWITVACTYDLTGMDGFRNVRPLYAAPVAAPQAVAQEPLAWLDDGSTRNGSESTSYRVITAQTKAEMPALVAAAFNRPLYGAPFILTDAQVDAAIVAWLRTGLRMETTYQDAMRAAITAAMEVKE